MEEEALCRVCRCGEEAGSLFFPCRCSGSIRYVHEECLVEWLRVSQKRSCELCRAEFRFTSVYHAGTPARLPTLEVLFGAVMLGFSCVPEVARHLVVVLIWCGLFPFLTSRVHEVLFCRSFRELKEVVFRFGWNEAVLECVQGMLLAGCIVCAFLALMVLQDFVRRTNRREERRRMELEALGLGIELPREEEDDFMDFHEPRNMADIADRVVEAAVAAAADANELVEELQAAGENNRLMEFGNRILRERMGPNFQHFLNDWENVPQVVDEIAAEVENEAEDAVVDGNDENNVALAPVEEELAWDALLGLRNGARGIQRGLYTMMLVFLANTTFLLVFQLVPFTIARIAFLAYSLHTESDILEAEVASFSLLGFGYGLLLGSTTIYTIVKKVIDIWKGRSTYPAPDIISQYVVTLWDAWKNMLSMVSIMLMELFLLEGIIGGIVHIGIMGVSGDPQEIFWNRVDVCVGSPLACVFIHWAVGSVVIANWSALIWAFRQVVHPSFKLRIFDGWYDSSKRVQVKIFGPMMAMQERRTREQNERWKERVSIVSSRILEEKHRHGSDSVLEDVLVEDCLDQAPVAEPDSESAPRLDVISQTLDESFSYVLTVLLMSLPAVIALLVLPISLTKAFFPGVFPLRIGSFEEPFTEAQLPLDVFLFHSLPYAYERLDMNQIFLDMARMVGRLLTVPLDLHGYTLKPQLQHLKTGFVHVDNAHANRSLESARKYSVFGRSPRYLRNLRVRRMRVPLEGVLPSLRHLSSRKEDERVDLLGVICAAPSWVDLSASLRPGKMKLRSFKNWEPLHVFTINDSLGYCVPVYLQLSEGTRSKIARRALDLMLMDPNELRVDAVEALQRFYDHVELLHDVDTERIENLREILDTSRSRKESVVEVFRLVREEVQDCPDLVDDLLEFLPHGFGTKWSGGSCLDLFTSILRIALLWRDRNLAPVIALKDARVCSEGGRSLIVDEKTLFLLEPDCGGKAELARICFQARREDTAATGQFCALRHEPENLSSRLRLLGFFAAVAAVVSSTLGLVLPLVTGRFAFSLIGDPLRHDLYHWGAGCFVLWFFGMLGNYFLQTVLTSGIVRASKLCAFWIVLGLKWIVAIAVFGILIPFLTGLLFELVFLEAFRVPTQRAPIVSIFQDWALGLALLKGWSRLVLLGTFGLDNDWRNRLEQVQYNGRYGLNLGWMLSNVAVPLLEAILGRLLFPFAIARVYAIHFHLNPETTATTVRFAYPVFSLVLFLRETLDAFMEYLDVIHDRVRDARYKIGQRLQNR